MFSVMRKVFLNQKYILRAAALLLTAAMLLPFFGCSKRPADLVDNDASFELSESEPESSAAESSSQTEEESTASSSSDSEASSDESSEASESEPASDSSSESAEGSSQSSHSSQSSKPSESSQSSQSSQPSQSSAASKPEKEPSSSQSSQTPAESESESSKPDSSSSSQSSQPSQTSSSAPDQSTSTPVPAGGEMRAMWFSYLDLNPMLTGKTKAQFTSAINAAFDNVAELGLNTVIVQVRPFADALYNSDYFPWSSYVTGKQGVAPSFDPLAVMIQAARARGLRIEAWINPYRVKTSGNSTASLSSDNMAKKWIAEENDAVVVTANGIYYNPASPDAQQLIVNGVKEIVANYDVDGIHFDDYFYPSPDNSFDAKSYAAYKSAGGKLSLGDWRRENVNTLVRNVYAAIKSIDSRVVFGISPQGNMWNNYNTQYIDVEKWVTNSGYIDYIMPQIYFGFNNTACPYTQTVANWNSLITNKNITLYIGLSPYKIGTTDNFAGNGKTEWLNNTDIIARQVTTSRKYARCGGFALFRYASVFSPAANVSVQVKTEMSNLKDVLS
ncbi:MAG: family 10 glycosylhydrolase [Oscillospiraceae bacterium]|nr:family 10 glycosylhydrolase [Oscillospiraceae bacterium]